MHKCKRCAAIGLAVLVLGLSQVFGSGPKDCPECQEPVDPTLQSAGAPPCVPMANGTKCGEDKCEPYSGIQGAKLVVTPTMGGCKNGAFNVDTGNPTDEDKIMKYECWRGACVPKQKEIVSDTVAVDVKYTEGRYECLPYTRQYTAVFTSSCDDPDITKTDSINLLDCAKDLECCQEKYEEDGSGGSYFCAILYQQCKAKCGE